jgi:hypothetical protein
MTNGCALEWWTKIQSQDQEQPCHSGSDCSQVFNGGPSSVFLRLSRFSAPLEMESQFGCVVSRRDEVRATESRQKIEECGLVCQVDNSKTQAPLIAIAVKEVVVAHCRVKQISWCDARWIVVHVECPEFRKDYSCCTTGGLTIRQYITS